MCPSSVISFFPPFSHTASSICRRDLEIQIKEREAQRRIQGDESPMKRRQPQRIEDSGDVINRLTEQPRLQTAVAVNRAAQMGSIVFGVRLAISLRSPLILRI